ncbi:ABC transporter permease [candidate division KSB1 bacterium]
MNSDKKRKPIPGTVRWILKPFFHSDKLITIIDDLEEGYFIKFHESGMLKAKIWYLSQFHKIIIGKIYNSIIWSVPMLGNYIKTAIRNIKRHKTYYSMNILGLGLGLSFYTLCLVYTTIELRFDKFHVNIDNIFNVVKINNLSGKDPFHSALMPVPMKNALVEEFPEIIAATTYKPAGKCIVKYRDKTLNESGLVFVDPAFLSIFSFNILRGDPNTVLENPFSTVISELTAKKYFGENDPVGKVLTVNGKIELTITGIIEEQPENSSLYYNLLVSSSTMTAFNIESGNWNTEQTQIFVQLNDKSSKNIVSSKFPAFITKHYSREEKYISDLYLLPFSDIHLSYRHISSFLSTSHKPPMYIFNSISIVLLLIACFNFINLSTAKSMSRMRELGIRSVVGAYKSQLRKQLLGESIIVSMLSVPVAGFLYQYIILPFFEALFGFSHEYFSITSYSTTFPLLFLTSIILGIFAGLYPAIIASRFKISDILKNSSTTGTGGLKIRKILIISQFVVSVIAVAITIMIVEQDKFLMDYDLGYSRTNLIALKTGGQVSRNYEVLRNQLLSQNDITSVSASNGLLTNWDTENTVIPEGGDKTDAVIMNTYGVHFDFVETQKLNLTSGRSFSRNFNENENIMINESALKSLGGGDPIGKVIKFNNRKMTIIGVLKNFHFKNIFFDTLPTLLYFEPDNLYYIYIQLSSPLSNEIIEKIESIWKKCYPDNPFEYYSIESRFRETNRDSYNFSRVFGLIGFIAVSYSMLGIIGLSLYSVQKRSKEICIRKVFGASVSRLLNSFFKEYFNIIIITFIIAVPLAYYLITKLMNFVWTFTAPIKPWVFIAVFIGTVISVAGCVIFQTLKAANSNPVDSLRQE